MYNLADIILYISNKKNVDHLYHNPSFLCASAVDDRNSESTSQPG